MANPLSLKDIADFKIPANDLVDDSDPTFSYYTSNGVPLYDRSYIKNKSANRTMFFPPEYVLIERSTDGGSTWTTVPTSGTNSVTLDQRRNLMGEVATNIAVGVGEQTTSMQMRITLKYTSGFYCSLDRAFIDFSNAGHSCEVKMDASTYGAQSTYTDIFGWKSIAGWSGPNLYKFPYKTAWGTNNNAHLYNVRFTFKYLSINSTYKTTSATVRMLNMYGVNYWGTAGEPRDNGFLYKWDSSKNVTFPAKVYSGTAELATKAYADTKLDKVTSASTNNQVYMKTSAGAQLMKDVSPTKAAWTIPYRNDKEQFEVGTPTADNHVATKKYVDDKKVDIDWSTLVAPTAETVTTTMGATYTKFNQCQNSIRSVFGGHGFDFSGRVDFGGTSGVATINKTAVPGLSGTYGFKTNCKVPITPSAAMLFSSTGFSWGYTPGSDPGARLWSNNAFDNFAVGTDGYIYLAADNKNSQAIKSWERIQFIFPGGVHMIDK